MEWALDGPMVRMVVFVMSAVAVYVGLGHIIHIVLTNVIPNQKTRDIILMALLMASYSGLLYVGFWVI